jgi:hypothetical protein
MHKIAVLNEPSRLNDARAVLMMEMTTTGGRDVSYSKIGLMELLCVALGRWIRNLAVGSW